jgi:hypothetical protein
MDLCQSFCSSSAREKLEHVCTSLEDKAAKYPTIVNWICKKDPELCSSIKSICQDFGSADKCTSACHQAAQQACTYLGDKGLEEFGCSQDSQACVAKICQRLTN